MLEQAAGVPDAAAAVDPLPDAGAAYLYRWDDQARLRRWPLPRHGGTVTIGRTESADVSVAWDPRVSRVHATLESVAGQWTIVDDGLSRNGTFVNGVRISGRARLRDGDRVGVGDTCLTFCAPAQTASQGTVVGDALPSRAHLTDPQRAVLVALCRPHKGGVIYAAPATNQHIADELFLSVEAVKTHLRTLFHKFGIEDLPQNQKRARLVELALQWGIVSDAEL